MILSVSIITQAGRIIVARQFNYFSRSQLEGHLGAFPKLITNSSQSYIETETIRYVFQLIGDIYFILITTKNSNIIEDLDVLSLLVNVTCSTMQVTEREITEELVSDFTFELLFAFDECIFDGYYQDVTVQDVTTFLTMESQEEDEFNRIRLQKEENAAKALREKMKELESIRKSKRSQKETVSLPPVTPIAYTSSNRIDTEIENPRPARTKVSKVKGMTLSKKTTARDRAQQMIEEEGLPVEERKPRTSQSSSARAMDEIEINQPQPPTDGTLIKFSEVMKGSVSRLGTIEKFSIEGRLIAESSEPGQYAIQMNFTGNSDKFNTRAFNQKDRKLFTQEKQLIFDSGKAEITLLGWRYMSKEADLPLSFSCWVTEDNQQSTFVCEVTQMLDNMNFDSCILTIPVKRVNECEIIKNDGETKMSFRDSLLQWTITGDDINSQKKAEIEFTAPLANEDDFFPINVEFVANSSYLDADVVSVAKIDANGNYDFNNPSKFEVYKCFSTTDFQIF